ncbi:MAG: dihydroneopterin aldolase [Alphaproteobacteria bacterium]|nr:dihydroneopterin aldolase [Alphaproteobacteria bacterium SS10]
MISLISKATRATDRATASASAPESEETGTKPSMTYRRMFLRDMDLEAEIGAYPEERGRTQRVRLNIEAVVADRIITEDDLDAVVSYELLRDAAHRVVSEGHINLVETMAERIAALSLSHPSVEKITIRIEKLDVFDDCAGAGVEITRERA